MFWEGHFQSFFFFVWLGGHFSSSFTCWVFLCLFVLFRLLCLGWSVVPFYCGGFSQWVGLDDWLVPVSWLGKFASVFWCMELDFFSLFSKTMSCFSGCLMPSASDQRLFCAVCSAFKCSFEEFVGEKVVSPSYSSAILAPPLIFLIKGCSQQKSETKSRDRVKNLGFLKFLVDFIISNIYFL